ncbi:MAG: serine hydrolase [Deltaproteobacteria bacterium]|jgi:CubicO group peptidase (beta-lactamase class C family)|nr:serine hydrolase [Deltaproteobacteria bacterium]
MNRFATVEEEISVLMERAREERVFSGCSLAIAQGSEELVENFGTRRWDQKQPIGDNTLFDLASLTKPLATSLAIFALLGQGKIGLNTALAPLLRQEVPEDKRPITLFQLHNQCSGLAGHRPFYKKLETMDPGRRKEEILRLILSEPLACEPGSRDIYSDLGFILLGLIVERQSGMALDAAVAHYIYEPLQMADCLVFNPLARGLTDFAATQHCPWRGRLLQGEVDDQNTWITGGVSGQAGLFGRGGDVLAMVRKLVEIASGAKKHPYLGQDLLKKAMSRQPQIKGSSWGLGFDTPAEVNSSAGRFISQRSCGHLGFTGTSFWHDFDRDITVVLLTNRVHPSVDNDKIKAFRPRFHDLIFQSLV